MGRVIAFRNGRHPEAETADDWRDEVTALVAERSEMVDAIRPIVARLAVYGVNRSPLVLQHARTLATIVDRAGRRSMGGAA